MARVREPTESDARRCAEVHVASWKAGYEGILPDDYLRSLSVDDRLPWWVALLSRDAASRELRVFVAEDPSGGVCGFGSRTQGSRDRTAELAQLYLAPAAWGTGTAEALLSRLIEDAVEEGVTLLTLRVAQKNARARRFYERGGWTRVGDSERTDEVWGVDVVTVEYHLAVGHS